MNKCIKKKYPTWLFSNKLYITAMKYEFRILVWVQLSNTGTGALNLLDRTKDIKKSTADIHILTPIRHNPTQVIYILLQSYLKVLWKRHKNKGWSPKLFPFNSGLVRNNFSMSDGYLRTDRAHSRIYRNTFQAENVLRYC